MLVHIQATQATATRLTHTQRTETVRERKEVPKYCALPNTHSIGHGPNLSQLLTQQRALTPHACEPPAGRRAPLSAGLRRRGD